MLSFAKNIVKEYIPHSLSSIEEIIIEQVFKINNPQNISCIVDFEDFQKMFEKKLGQVDSKIVFSVIDKNEFYLKYFGPLIVPNSEHSKIQLKGIRKLFRDRYDLKLTLRKYLELGIKMSLRFIDEAKEYFGKIFKIFDENNDGQISFQEFRKIIKKIDPQRADWKIHAIYQRATGLDNSEKG